MYQIANNCFFLSCTGTSSTSEDVLVNALTMVLEDDSFKIKTPALIQTRQSAEKFLEWCLQVPSKGKVKLFGEKLTQDLQGVIRASIKKKSHNCNKEIMWRQYYLLRTSEKFVTQWNDFLSDVNTPVQPVLFQHLTDVIFKTLVEDYFKIEYLEQETVEVPTSDENNVIRYIAGYLCRHLRKNLERENHELKEEMILCLMALTKDKPEEVDETEEWTKKVDRGGLWYVKETTFQLFYAIEHQIRSILKLLKTPSNPCKSEIIKRILSDDDVQFYWEIASADFEIDDDETKNLLLTKMVQLFLTVRGFSYAGVTMEKHKQLTKKSIQRSKSLRRDLHDKIE